MPNLVVVADYERCVPPCSPRRALLLEPPQTRLTASSGHSIARKTPFAITGDVVKLPLLGRNNNLSEIFTAGFPRFDADNQGLSRDRLFIASDWT